MRRRNRKRGWGKWKKGGKWKREEELNMEYRKAKLLRNVDGFIGERRPGEEKDVREGVREMWRG